MALLTLCVLATRTHVALAQQRRPSPARRVRVAFDARGARPVFLARATHPDARFDKKWKPICRAPCTAWLDERYRLRVEGPDIPASGAFQLSSVYPNQRIDVRADTGSSAGRIAGWSMVLGGGALFGLGFAMTLNSIAKEERNSALAPISMLGGLGLSVAGAFELGSSSATVHVAVRAGL